ncbi:TetR family transcriptional regulator C-terminal domain-containing protein [Nguyenibacter sp. L1]|uniref:TetR/AcrR family transcriptional regulator n=1 Tax=Nguyenibacter sp. L1 TaxID=3049350 RepID=UPI002B49D795|nr:hypothetical protein [Nguyenibacter sp. L1]WRH89793.1 hypothetical protein QN315_09460 [Nguyenibacter sp. L1]
MLAKDKPTDEIREKSKSGRKKTRDQRIADIVETAAEIFVRDGYAQFSARRVASELNITLSNLQHYCGTTENLLLLMVRMKIGSFNTRFRDVAAKQDLSARDRLMAVIEEDLAATLDPWIASFSFQAWALADHDKAVRDSLKDVYQAFCVTLTQLITEVNPKLSTAQANVFATLIASQIEGLLFFYNRAGLDQVNSDVVLQALKAQWLDTIIGR